MRIDRSATPDPTTRTPAAAVAGSPGRWGGLEVTAVVVLGLAWPALLLPFGLYLWIGLGVAGLVLTWASGVWRLRQKLSVTVVIGVLYAVVIAATMPAPRPIDNSSPSEVVENLN